MKYIPEYYAITKDEYEQGQKLSGKHIDPNIGDLLNECDNACIAYKKEIIEAIEQAYKKHIVPYLHKNIVYSRTWGK
jgi:hypothetical protein